MNICAKISNPMALTDIAFSERAYGALLFFKFVWMISCVCMCVCVSTCFLNTLVCFREGNLFFEIKYIFTIFVFYLQLRSCTTTARPSARAFIPTSISAILLCLVPVLALAVVAAV